MTKDELVNSIKKMNMDQLIENRRSIINANRTVNTVGVLSILTLLILQSIPLYFIGAVIIYIAAKIGSSLSDLILLIENRIRKLS